MKTLIKTSFVLALVVGLLAFGLNNAYAKNATKDETGSAAYAHQTHFKGIPFQFNANKMSNSFISNLLEFNTVAYSAILPISNNALLLKKDHCKGNDKQVGRVEVYKHGHHVGTIYICKSVPDNKKA